MRTRKVDRTLWAKKDILKLVGLFVFWILLTSIFLFGKGWVAAIFD